MNKRYQFLKSRGSNRCLTPISWGLRAAYAVHLCPVLPGTELPATWRVECVEFFHRTFLVVSLLNRFGFHDETSVNGRKFRPTITRLMVDRTYVFHLLFLIYFLSKRVKKPLVLETLETNEVYLQRHRWFFHLRTSPKKKVLSAGGKVTCAVFFFRQFFLYHCDGASVQCIPEVGGCVLRPLTSFLPDLLNCACTYPSFGTGHWQQINSCPAGTGRLYHLYEFPMQKVFAFLVNEGYDYPQFVGPGHRFRFGNGAPLLIAPPEPDWEPLKISKRDRQK